MPRVGPGVSRTQGGPHETPVRIWMPVGNGRLLRDARRIPLRAQQSDATTGATGARLGYRSAVRRVSHRLGP